MTASADDVIKVPDRDDEGDAIALADEPFLYLPDLADKLEINLKTLRKLIDFDAETGRPSAGSQFPNAYKETPARTARIRVPVSDVERYKINMMKGFGNGGKG